MVSSNDDFLVPDGVDYNTKCDTESLIINSSTIFPIGAVLSLVCYMYLLWMYFVVKAPLLKRHPTTLAIYKCMFDVVFVQQYLWLPYVSDRFFYSDDLGGAPYYCNASKAAAYLAFLTQFSLLGSELCFLIISVDLRNAYTNPFSSFKQNRIYFVGFVVGFALLTAIGLMLMGREVYGLATEGSVWIQARREDGSPPYAKFILYYLIVSCIYVYCLWANFQFYVSTEKGLSRTISNRLSIMNRSKKFNLCYILYDTVTLSLEFASYVSPNNAAIKSLPAYFYCFRGVCALVIILYSNSQDLTWSDLNPFTFASQDQLVEKVALEGLTLQPHLNTVLRAEILYFTTQGIMHAVREFDNFQNRIVVNKPSHGGGAAGGGGANSSSINVNELNEEEYGTSESLYSFDENPSNNGIRPSLIGVGAHRASGMRPSILKRLSGRMTEPPLENSNNNNHQTADTEEGLGNNNYNRGGGGGGGTETLVKLQKLNAEQNQAVSRMIDGALQEEVESLGLRSSNVGLVRRNTNLDSSLLGPPPAQQQQGGNNRSSARMGAAVESNSRSVMSPFYFKDSDSADNVQEFEMRNTLESKASEHSDSSEVTVKWRDTMDVEFTMRQSGPFTGGAASSSHHNNHNSSSSGRRATRSQDTEDFSSGWKRVSDASSVMFGDNNNGDGRKSSNTSAAERVRKALQVAVNSAKLVFQPAYQEFRFKDFCPKLFAKVRAMCGINAYDYANSFETTCKERFSEGRSGAFMFFSSDQRCIVKTTTKQELLDLHGMMPKYVKYLEDNPNSLIVRFLGAHCITMYGVELYFLVMLNFFPKTALSERYDLKGSWVNRHGSGGKYTRSEQMRMELPGVPPLYQDNDLQNKISLSQDVVHEFAEQIRLDIVFLRDLNRMDYSLLIGVKRERFEVLGSKESASSSTDTPRESQQVRRPPSGRNSAGGLSASAAIAAQQQQRDKFMRDSEGGLRARYVEGPGVYYIGIIDVLQEWNYQKQLERWFKMYVKFLDGDGISAINSADYADRFWKRCVIDTLEGLEYDGFQVNNRIPSVNALPSNHTQHSGGGGTSFSDAGAVYGSENPSYVQQV